MRVERMRVSASSYFVLLPFIALSLRLHVSNPDIVARPVISLPTHHGLPSHPRSMLETMATGLRQGAYEYAASAPATMLWGPASHRCVFHFSLVLSWN